MKTPTSLMGVVGLIFLMTSLPIAFAQNVPSDVAAPPPAEANVSTPAIVDPAPIPKNISPSFKLLAWSKEIAKLAEARIDEEVILSFVDGAGMFNLSADQIISLSDHGVSGVVISAMLRHDQEATAGLRTLTITSDPGYEPLPHGKLVLVTNAPVPLVVSESSADVIQDSPATSSVPAAATPELIFPPVEKSRSRSKPDKYVYPVRSPQPEQILPPVVFVKSAAPPPNVFIIERFPPDEP